jgi:hypothetical protein
MGTCYVADQLTRTRDGVTFLLLVEDDWFAGHGPTGYYRYSVSVLTRYGWTRLAKGKCGDRESAEVNGRDELRRHTEKFGTMLEHVKP